MSEIDNIKDEDKKDFADEYQTAIETMTQIIDAPTLTQEQAVNSIQYTARILRFIIKMIWRRWI